MGDVVVYTPKDLGGHRVIHRVVGGDAVTGWTVRGDNNPGADPWHPTDVVGVAVMHVAGLGKAATLLLSPLLWISLIVLALALFLWPRGADAGATVGPGDPADVSGGPGTVTVTVPDADADAHARAGADTGAVSSERGALEAGAVP